MKKVSVIDERSLEKSKKHRKRASEHFFAANSTALAFSRGTPSHTRWEALGTNLIKKVSVIDERSLGKSKKHRARASGEHASIVFYS